MKNKHFKLINRAYRKNLKLFCNNFCIKQPIGLLVLVEHLRWIRDTLILASIEDTKYLNEQLFAISAAIAEFDACKNSNSRQFHWNSFCAHLRHSMKDWLNLNDSI